MRKLKNLGIRLALFASLIMVVSACTTYVSPKKVERIITVDSWKITSFIFNGTDIASQFSDKTVGFGESGTITFFPTIVETGSWTTSSGRKPTLLYIQGFVADPYFNLNDDWTVVECGKFTVKLESEVGSTTNTITLIKIE